MKKKIVKTIINDVYDNDIGMEGRTTQDTWDWLLDCAEANYSENVCNLLYKVKIKNDYKFQHKLLDFVARQMQVHVDNRTECYTKQ